MHRKAHPKRAVVGKTGANSGRSTIFGGPIAPNAVIIAPEEIDAIESVLPRSIIPGQSIALKTIGRISNFRPPIIVDLPEMKGLLATSTVFLHSKRRKKIAIHLIDRRTQKKMPDAFKQSGICNNWAMCAYSVIAPTGHSSMHVPQSMQESAFTVQTSATERASCGQASTQTPHATQSSALMVTAIF